jgi:8-oxo-dGTP diphosphatase
MGAHEQGADAVKGRWRVVARTLCFIMHGDDVLLMKRAAHKRVFPNRYNGVGGHMERYEDPLECARREIWEETGLDAVHLRLRAVYNIDSGGDGGIVLFVFTGEAATRETRASDEGSLHWVAREQVYELPLVEDLPHLLPRIFAMGESDPPYFVHVEYDPNDQIVMRWQQEEMDR